MSKLATAAVVFQRDEEDDYEDEDTGMWCWVCGDDDHNPRPSCIGD